MAIASIEQSGRRPCFPLVTVVAQEPNRSKPEGLSVPSRILYNTLAKAAGFNDEQKVAFYAQLFDVTTRPLSNSISDKLDRLVQQVIKADVVNNSSPSPTLRHIGNDQVNVTEIWIGQTKAMKTALHALQQFLQLKLNIPSKQAIKREATLQTARRKKEPTWQLRAFSNKSYRKAIAQQENKLVASNATPEIVECYMHWKKQIAEKALVADKMHDEYKKELHSLMAQKNKGRGC